MSESLNVFVFPQASPDEVFTVKGFSCTSPRRHEVERFVQFIDRELAPRGVNTLVLFVCDKDFNYQFIDAFYGKQPAGPAGRWNPADGFRALYTKINELEQKKP